MTDSNALDWDDLCEGLDGMSGAEIKAVTQRLDLAINQLFGVIAHGERFDDGRRWCLACQRPRWVCEPSDDRVGLDLGCMSCGTLWPEPAEQYAVGLLSDEDVGENFEWNTVH